MDDLREIDALTTASGGRAVGRQGNAVVSTFVGRRLEAAGLRVYEQAFQDRLGGTMRNVIAVLPGSLEGSVLVSAHHDANGSSPAAVEGTAGLAILLELARAASEAGARPEGREAPR
jgi:hypothetical protein